MSGPSFFLTSRRRRLRLYQYITKGRRRKRGRGRRRVFYVFFARRRRSLHAYTKYLAQLSFKKNRCRVFPHFFYIPSLYNPPSPVGLGRPDKQERKEGFFSLSFFHLPLFSPRPLKKRRLLDIINSSLTRSLFP